MRKNAQKPIINLDANGNAIPEAFPVSKGAKKDHRKTSVIYTLLAFLLHLLAVLPPVGVTLFLALKTYDLVPYYSFWPFVAVIVVGVMAIIFTVVTLIVTRPKTKSSIMSQTAKVAATFVCVTSGLGIIVTYVSPDIIATATSYTLFNEDLYYNGENQLQTNAKYDREFIMANLVTGTLNDSEDPDGDFSYKTLSKQIEQPNGNFLSYENDEIQTYYDGYMQNRTKEVLQTEVLDVLKEKSPRKYELYEFIYNNFVLLDFDYALTNGLQRRAFTLSMVDYIYNHFDYEGLLKEGFHNQRLLDLFHRNYDSFNQDGYQTFDDSLLLYAQLGPRMTVPVVLRLILNGGWKYSQPSMDDEGNMYYTEDGQNFLYEMYSASALEEFKAAGGTFDYTGKMRNNKGEEIEVNYGFNKDGWMVFENGMIRRPIDWLVLDMLGTPMDVTQLDLAELIGNPTIMTLVEKILNSLGSLTDAVGDLITEDLQNVIEYATNGCNLNIAIYMNDNDRLAISIVPMNYHYGILGYQQATYMQSNNLLMAVINVMGARNWLYIFGSIGTILVIAAGILRECGKRTRERTEVSRDRIIRAKSQPVGDLSALPEKYEQRMEAKEEEQNAFAIDDDEIKVVEEKAHEGEESEKAEPISEEKTTEPIETAHIESVSSEASEEKPVSEQKAESVPEAEEVAEQKTEEPEVAEEKKKEKKAKEPKAPKEPKEPKKAKEPEKKEKEEKKPSARPTSAGTQRPTNGAARPTNGSARPVQRPANGAARPTNGQRPTTNGQRPANGSRPASARPAGQRPTNGAPRPRPTNGSRPR